MGKEKQKMVMIGAVGVVLLGLIIYFGIVKTYDVIGETNAKIKLKQGEIQGYQDKIDKIPDLKRKKEAIQDVLEDFIRILPDDANDEHFALLTMINDYQIETNMDFDMFKPVERRGRKKKGQVEDLGFVQQQFRLEIEGQFFDLARLLNLIERTEKFLRIDNFHLFRPEARGTEGRDLTHLRAEITMSTFTYKEKKETARRGQ